MCRGSIQERFASAAITTSRPKAGGQDHDNIQFCLDVCNRIVVSLAEGHPVDVACAGAGIGRTTFYRWLERARLPDAPEALVSFRNSVDAAKHNPKKPLAPAFAKRPAAIGKRPATPRSKKAMATSTASASGRPQSAPIVQLAKDLVPAVDYVNYRYLPAVFRSNLLMTIHSMARDFPLDKKLSELSGDERCVFESLVTAIAHSSCQIPEHVNFIWDNAPVTVLFTDFEFTRPIIHRLAARYIRDRQRHTHVASAPASTQHKEESAECSFMEVDYESDDDWFSHSQFSDQGQGLSETSTIAAVLDDSRARSPRSSCFLEENIFAASSDADDRDLCAFGDELPLFAEENLCDFDSDFFMFTM
jgi:hypothetical protein